MSWSKQELVEEAFAEIALAGYVIDLGAEQLQTGLRRLDAMMAKWNGKGIRLGYPLPSSPSESSLDTDSSLPDVAIEAVYTNLAIALAGVFGKQLLQDTRNRAKEGYDLLLSRTAMPPEMQFPSTLPRGAGNKPWRTQNNPFMPTPDDPLEAGGDGPIEFT